MPSALWGRSYFHLLRHHAKTVLPSAHSLCQLLHKECILERLNSNFGGLTPLQLPRSHGVTNSILLGGFLSLCPYWDNPPGLQPGTCGSGVRYSTTGPCIPCRSFLASDIKKLYIVKINIVIINHVGLHFSIGFIFLSAVLYYNEMKYRLCHPGKNFGEHYLVLSVHFYRHFWKAWKLSFVPEIK